jgi:multiple sugar transport system substrate-binding protein
MKKLGLGIMMLALIGATLFAAGGQGGSNASSSNAVRVVWWGSDSRHTATLESIALFEKSNPNIKVMPEYMGFDSYFDKLNVQIAGGNAPDVIQFGTNVPDYVSMNALLELDKYQGNVLDLSRFDKDAIELGIHNGKLYGVCLGTNIQCLIYNKSMIERAGVPLPKDIMTWDELRQYALTLASRLPAGVWPFTDNSNHNKNYFEYWMRWNGTPVYRNGTTMSSAAAIQKWIEIWEDYRTNKLIPDAETSASYNPTNLENHPLVNGKTVFSWLWTNQVSAVQGLITDELGVIQLPDVTKGANFVQPSQFFSVNKKSANPDGAVAFVSFFVNDPAVGEILRNDRGVSCSTVIRTSNQASASQAEKLVYAVYDTATKYTTPWDTALPNDQEYTNTYRLFIDQVAFKQITPQQGARSIFELIQQMLVK